MALCFASAGVIKAMSVTAFTLAWVHSVEHTEWQEDWRLTPQGLQIVEARVKGSGAGMEPPPDARLVDGWFRWAPHRTAQREVTLGNSGVAGEWKICADGNCQALSGVFGQPIGSSVTTMSVCESAEAAQVAAVSRDAPICNGGDAVQADALLDACSTVANYGATPNIKVAALLARAGAWRSKGERRHALDDYDAALRLDPASAAARDQRKNLFHEIELLGAKMPLKPSPAKSGG